MIERAALVLPNSEFPVGSKVPILEHLGRRGFSCPGLQGSVTELDERNRPKKATCDVVDCGKAVTIDWARIQLNRETIAAAKAAIKGKARSAKKPAR